MDWGQKRSQSNKIDLRVFCEKLPFDSLCSNESCIFHVRFLCIKNIPCKALDSGKNGIWNGSQMIWDSFQTSVIIAENLHFLCL